MSKYDALTQHLQELKGGRWDASFSDIEGILGFQLPTSAREYPAWWANQLKGQRVQCRSWMNAGWQTINLDLVSERVTFQRVGDRTEGYGAVSYQKEGPQAVSEAIHLARIHVSTAAGVPADRVKISIEY